MQIFVTILSSQGYKEMLIVLTERIGWKGKGEKYLVNTINIVHGKCKGECGTDIHFINKVGIMPVLETIQEIKQLENYEKYLQGYK